MNNRIFHLVYRSHASILLNNNSIQDILKFSRETNLKIGITGILIFRKNYFIQLIEGDEDKVRNLYSKICRDEHHENEVIILESISNERIYNDWSMAYVEGGINHNLTSGLFDLFDDVIQNSFTDKKLVLPILKKFLSDNHSLL